jgi:hypothetical protein
MYVYSFTPSTLLISRFLTLLCRVGTVHLVNDTKSSHPISAIYGVASHALMDFQSATGIHDEALGPPPPYRRPEQLADLPVGILGAGVAGLYSAMILDSLGIKYEIMEGSRRHGGRLYTHKFKEPSGPYQYFVSTSFLDFKYLQNTHFLFRTSEPCDIPIFRS